MKLRIASVILSSSALVAATLALGACATEPRETATVRYDAPRPSATVRDAQLRLMTLGEYHGPADGLWGPATDDAVARFQRSHHLVVTARLDDPTRDALEDATSTRPIRLEQAGEIREVQERLRGLNFYDGPIDGVWGDETQAALERFQRARGIYPGQVTVVSLSAMGLDPRDLREREMDERAVAARPEPARAPAVTPAVASGPLEARVVRGVQRRLGQLGFYRAAADGIWGPATKAALADFQASRGLEPTGDLTPVTATRLGLNPNDLRSSVATYRP